MSRMGIFIYGIVSYAIFFAVFLYGIGFIGGFLTPPEETSFAVDTLMP